MLLHRFPSKRRVRMLFNTLEGTIVVPFTVLVLPVQIFDPMLTSSISAVDCKRSQAMVAAPHSVSRKEGLLSRNTERQERGTPKIEAQWRYNLRYQSIYLQRILGSERDNTGTSQATDQHIETPKITAAPFLISRCHGGKYGAAIRDWRNADGAVMIETNPPLGMVCPLPIGRCPISQSNRFEGDPLWA